MHSWTSHPGVRTLPTKDCSRNIFEIGVSWNNLKNEPGTLPNDRTWPLSYVDSLDRTPCPLAEPLSDVNLYFPCPALPPWVFLYKPVKNPGWLSNLLYTILGAWVSTPELWSMFHVLSCCCSIKSCLLHFKYGLSVFLGPRLSRGLSEGLPSGVFHLLEIELRISERAVSALNHLAICQLPCYCSEWLQHWVTNLIQLSLTNITNF